MDYLRKEKVQCIYFYYNDDPQFLNNKSSILVTNCIVTTDVYDSYYWWWRSSKIFSHIFLWTNSAEKCKIHWFLSATEFINQIYMCLEYIAISSDFFFFLYGSANLLNRNINTFWHSYNLGYTLHTEEMYFSAITFKASTNLQGKHFTIYIYNSIWIYVHESLHIRVSKSTIYYFYNLSVEDE